MEATLDTQYIMGVGPYSGTYPDMEATLDTQYIMGVGQNEVDWYWTSTGWMYDWSTNFFNHTTHPDSVSISWGWAEDGQCQSGIDSTVCSTGCRLCTVCCSCEHRIPEN